MKDDTADASAATKPTRPVFKTCRLLPYWAVYQSDIHQTLRSWVYRVWVVLSVLVALGYVLYRLGAYREASLVHPASELISDLLRWSVLGTMTLIIIMTAGCISSERGTLADSVLSRGISRHQYFFGKWSSRMTTVLGTFLFLTGLVVAGSLCLLHDERLHLMGTLTALGIVVALLVVVTTCSVMVSALSNNTVIAITVVWMVLYGTGFLLSLLPAAYPTPDRALKNLPNMLRGLYDLQTTNRLVATSLGISILLFLTGLFGFSRRDV